MNRPSSHHPVPAVLPRIWIAEKDGTYLLSSDIDGAASSPEQVPARALGMRVADLVHQADSAVRLEVVGSDGAVHADILDPTSLPTGSSESPRDTSTEAAALTGHNDQHAPQREPTTRHTLLVVDVSGWKAGEAVTVAVILGTTRADGEGNLHLELDPDRNDNLDQDDQDAYSAEVEPEERGEQPYGRGRVLLLGATSGNATAWATGTADAESG